MKIRVLEVLATLKRAGAERVAVSLACGLDRARFETGVVSLYDAFEDGFEPVLAERGVPVWHLGKRRGFDPRMWTRLARVFREFRPHVIHTQSYVLRYVLPVRMGTVVHTVQNVAQQEVDAIGRLIHRIAFRTGVVPVAVSKEVARSFREVYGFDPAATIYNGVDTRTAPSNFRRERGFADDDLLIASVARLEPQKNPLGLIDAFQRALGDRPNAHLILAGDGTLRARAESLAAGKRVRFLGVYQDVPGLLAACDVFALASDWEGTPLALIEAMAARLPVVATAVGGVPEIVEDGVSGVLVKHASAMTGALRALADDPARRHAMGAAAARRAVLFEARTMWERYAELFQARASAVPLDQ